jgi:prepilin-type N-terminal cleavage/methylation domain-containing protein
MPLARPGLSRGFTLIELLTVIAIIGILAAIIIPVTSKVRDTAKATKTLANVRTLAQAGILFAADNKDRLPFYNPSQDGLDSGNQTEWNHPNTGRSGPTLYRYLANPDVILSPDDIRGQELRVQRGITNGSDFPSYGMNQRLENPLFSAATPRPRIYTVSRIVNPAMKIFFAETGHSTSTPPESTRTSNRVFAQFAGGSSEPFVLSQGGVFARRKGGSVPVSFMDGHAKLVPNALADPMTNPSASADANTYYQRHWWLDERP